METILREGAALYLWSTWEERDALSEDIKKNCRLFESMEASSLEEIKGILDLFPDGKFNVIVVCHPALSDELFALALLKLLPVGKLVQLAHSQLTEELQGRMVLSGYVKLRTQNGWVVAEKPNYAMSSALPLSLGAKQAEQKAKVAAVWTIDNDDEDVMDADELLDEEDLAKPDPASNRVCGTTGKRKACKDCSCGLADELDNERKPKVDPNQKSSCGSCYLGDAFRCASCPYAGMPAFKPGEKIQLNDNFLDAA